MGYYLAALLPAAGYVVLANLRFDHDGPKSGWLSTHMLFQFLILAYPMISGFAFLMGIIVFGCPRDRRPGPTWRWNPDFTLIVSWVSRGHQPVTLQRATSQTQQILDQLGVFYELEVITDVDIAPANLLVRTKGDIHYVVVPKEYQTCRGARYKARALQYLLEHRTSRLLGREETSNIWILHMDEESLITPECVLGIQEHIQKYDLRRTQGAIGQGEILYNSLDYGDNLWTAAIDASRTGGDLGQFRTQYKALHKPLIGMHGSYVLTPARIEREITWDVGGHGSITEDSYFALLAMERGVPFDWVEGFIREQSPLTILDIIRQRRRWFCGLAHVARDPALRFKTRLALRVFVWFWAFSALALPLPLIYLVQRFLFGSGIIPWEVFMLAAVCTGLYASAYSVGSWRNLRHCSMPMIRKAQIMVFTIVAWFFFVPALVECAGTLYGLFFPVSSFYVVAKDTARKHHVTAASL